jgi:hypothetical protein
VVDQPGGFRHFVPLIVFLLKPHCGLCVRGRQERIAWRIFLGVRDETPAAWRAFARLGNNPGIV